MTIISTRQRALNWWNDLDVEYQDKLVKQYTKSVGYKSIENITNSEIEDLYTKVNHN